MTEYTESAESNGQSPTNHHVTRISPTAHDLLERCQTLLQELEDFKEYLKGRRQDHTVEIAHFRNTVKSEHRTLTRLSKVQSEASITPTTQNSEKDQDATQHTVNSSNLPFLETVWNTVKNTRGLQALQKRFYWNENGLLKPGRRGGRNKKQQSALVDIVTDDGLSWMKVSLLTNTRLLFDKAKQGWEDASSDEEDGDDEDGAASEDDPENDVPLVKMTRDLFRAANEVKIRTRHPKVTLMLPKIHEGQIPEIDNILRKLRDMGAIISTSTSKPTPTPLSAVMTTLLTDPFASLTPTLNIDCTILLALVSDFSHCSVEAEPWFHRALKRQVEIEDQENLLPSLLYPALEGRQLICTIEAAKRMREIVDTIGTPGEKSRTRLFMGDTSPPPSREEILAELQEWSRFPVPSTLHLPIVTTAANTDVATLPPSAKLVEDHLTTINQSVFLHGWSIGATTVTSNRTVVKQIESLLGENATDEGEWPLIWLCPTARSLVGKEKGRRE